MIYCEKVENDASFLKYIVENDALYLTFLFIAIDVGIILYRIKYMEVENGEVRTD